MHGNNSVTLLFNLASVFFGQPIIYKKTKAKREPQIIKWCTYVYHTWAHWFAPRDIQVKPLKVHFLVAMVTHLENLQIFKKYFYALLCNLCRPWKFIKERIFDRFFTPSFYCYPLFTQSFSFHFYFSVFISSSRFLSFFPTRIYNSTFLYIYCAYKSIIWAAATALLTWPVLMQLYLI